MIDRTFGGFDRDRAFIGEEDKSIEEREIAYWEKVDRDYDSWKDEQCLDD